MSGGGPGQTRIVNKALALLGTTTRILSINDSAPVAKLANSLWDEVRDEVQSDHPWNECIARAQLSASADIIPVCGYATAYDMPGDKLRWLPWDESDSDYVEGEEEGGYFVTDATGAVAIRYIRRIEDVARWSPGLTSAISAKLAFYMAKPVTGQSSVMRDMDALYTNELASARKQDGLASGRRQRRAEFRSNWISARYGGGTAGGGGRIRYR